jgi:hypothetical protein
MMILPRYVPWLARARSYVASGLALTITALALFLAPSPAEALPLYARQTGYNCDQCHTIFPALTPYGRRFKLNGYTQGGGSSDLPPLAVMVQTGFTETATPQPGGAAPHFAANDNLALQQISVFTGGRITDNVGAFIQGTYDGVARQFVWDNIDIRYANQSSLFGTDLTYGLTLNNNPTVQDAWNTTPAWSFPYMSSALVPTPAASPLINGGLAQQVAGLGAYAWVDDWIYAEISGYRTVSKSFQKVVGVDPAGASPIDGVAPYWRVALEPSWGKHSIEIGTFGLSADIVPQRINAFGTDHFTDIGLDAQYQFSGDLHDVTIHIPWVDEIQDLNASHQLGLADNAHNVLRSFTPSIAYTYDHSWQVTEQYFITSGSTDFAAYGTFNGSPNTSGFLTQLAWSPFSHGGPAFWPTANGQLILQYTAYTKFNGATTNVDGNGARASDNNSLFLGLWVAF